MEEYATKEQLVELERKVEQGFADLNHKLETLNLTLQQQNDERYAKQSDTMREAMLRLDDPVFRAKAMTVGNDWACSPDGKQHIRNVFQECVSLTRDNASKWISFIKLAFGALATLLLGYVGLTVLNNQKEITSLIHLLK